MKTKKAIIIGATSGIGKELALILSQKGYQVGLTGRRENLLRELQNELHGKSKIKKMDVAQTDAASQQLEELVAEMKDVELIVINAGVGTGSKPTWEQEKKVIDINVSGFTAIATTAMNYFTERGSGHIVGISSIAALSGWGRAPAYCASKAFISTYMQGLRHKSTRLKLNITITDVKPGFVETPLTDGRPGMFWVAPVAKAVKQIYRAIRKRKSHVYITKRWRLAAWVIKTAPDWVLRRMPG